MTTPPDTTMQPRELLKVEAAAKRLSVGRTTMFKLIKAGHIETVQVGHLRRVPDTAIADYIAKLTAAQRAA
ncbi:excisionase family DNA-binding protein [Amycolatopsis sp. NBC_01488]|uniref:excisionase family DNA-binding protein n=1 Tax=Amycolatopsis sp. NBC_01488 TaxID=2903563 RepID=UPI002E29F11D|nr:excisionase family DNA-binding protein [Amycolatopsis sp. NBC_01488]